MKQFLLILIGLLVVWMQQYLQPLSVNLQFIIFISGILLLGVPHGAADTLVANQNALAGNKKFSQARFSVMYLGRLVLFALVLWLFPLTGNLLFVFLAAYHFGETDLYQFNLNSLLGKVFITTYGLVILCVILLNHFEEMKPLCLLFKSGQDHAVFINWLDTHRQHLILGSAMLFIITSTVFFIKQKTAMSAIIQLMCRLLCILFILYNLPMVLGFTFYFIVWHSLMSLINIIRYLTKSGLNHRATIAKQIGINSAVAFGGIALFGLTGFMFTNSSTMTAYVFLGLAVLTAPHMQIMHDMYTRLSAS